MTRAFILSTTLATTAIAAEPSAAAPATSHVEARAAEARPQPYRLTARGELGLGLWAAQAGVSGEYWFSRFLGAGLHGGWFGFSYPFEREGSAVAAAGTLNARTGGGWSYGILSVGGGVGSFRETRLGGFCLDFSEDDESSCRPPVTHSGIAPYVGGALGWLFHPGGVEVGPLVRIDYAGEVLAVTGGFGIGFAGRLGRNADTIFR